MNPERMNKFWFLATISLIAIIIISSLLIWARHSNGQPVDILLPQSLSIKGEVYVGGAISNPGIYPLNPEDTLGDIIEASGGAIKNADISRLRIYVPEIGEGLESQRVDINRADAWLLEALPGIGNVRAQAIIKFRLENGLFHSVDELTSVPGITDTVLVKIKNLITLTN